LRLALAANRTVEVFNQLATDLYGIGFETGQLTAAIREDV
jgi:hypothetical protein